MKPDCGRVKLYWSRSGINEDLVERDRCMVRDRRDASEGVVLQIERPGRWRRCTTRQTWPRREVYALEEGFSVGEVQFGEIDQ